MSNPAGGKPRPASNLPLSNFVDFRVKNPQCLSWWFPRRINFNSFTGRESNHHHNIVNVNEFSSRNLRHQAPRCLWHGDLLQRSRSRKTTQDFLTDQSTGPWGCLTGFEACCYTETLTNIIESRAVFHPGGGCSVFKGGERRWTCQADSTVRLFEQ